MKGYKRMKTLLNRSFAEKGIWGKPLAFVGIWDNLFVQTDDELATAKAQLESRGLTLKKVGNPVTFKKDTKDAQVYDKYQVVQL